MKAHFLSVATGLLLSFSCCAQHAALDEASGFRGIRLGTPFSSFTGLVKDPGKPYSFTRPADTLSFAGVPLLKVEYHFVGGKLGEIALLYQNPRHNEPIKQALIKRFGRVKEPAHAPGSAFVVETIAWRGDKTWLNFFPAAELVPGTISFQTSTYSSDYWKQFMEGRK